jgi:Tfp pilus assembly protein PilF
MTWRGEQLVFRRFQTDDKGRERNALEQPVEWILGSGNHSRTYLYRTASGELFQLPVAWYTQEGRLGMAPGYDRADHDEIARRVRRECMFCHNAYPETPAGSDERGAPQTFPAELPEGTGCQRCHGPGGEHAKRALDGDDGQEVRAAIVNPARLPAARRDDVCFQCHLQPSVAIPGTRRMGRADYSFRPGQALGDYLVPTDVVSGTSAPADRFEINHHPYRLRSSRCAQVSGERLSCLTCHDPHRKVPTAERAAHYRAACLGCHAADATASAHRTVEPARDVLQSDCTACHMPPRRPQDVVHVVMTDHRIGIHRDLERAVTPLAESEPDIVDVRFWGLEPAPAGAEASLYRALATVSAAGSSAGPALAALQRLTAELDPKARDPYLELVPALLHARDLTAAERAIGHLLALRPDDPLALDWLAVVRARQQRALEAEQILRTVAQRAPAQAETHVNLGRLLLTRGELAAAAAELERAAELRPNLVPAWYYLAAARRRAGDRAGEIAALERGLAVEPGETMLYIELAAAYEASERSAEARQLRRFALGVARQPERLTGAAPTNDPD